MIKVSPLSVLANRLLLQILAIKVSSIITHFSLQTQYHYRLHYKCSTITTILFIIIADFVIKAVSLQTYLLLKMQYYYKQKCNIIRNKLFITNTISLPIAVSLQLQNRYRLSVTNTVSLKNNFILQRRIFTNILFNTNK